MKLFSYVVNSDSGFAPNPFWDFCTLANCKPLIRKSAKVGDWIAGISGKSQGNKLIYAMKVTEVLSYALYFNDRRFVNKKPDFSKGIKFKCGDNIYEPLKNGEFKQLRSMHSLDKSEKEDAEKKKKDLKGNHVLISDNFIYFGKSAIDIPTNLQNLIVARGHKYKCFDDNFIKEFECFISSQEKNVIDCPAKWGDYSDNTWRS